MYYLFVMLMGTINSSAVALAVLPEFGLLLNWNDAPSITIAPESAEAPSRACCIIGLEQISDLRKEMLAHIRSAASLMHHKTFYPSNTDWRRPQCQRPSRHEAPSHCDISSCSRTIFIPSALRRRSARLALPSSFNHRRISDAVR